MTHQPTPAAQPVSRDLAVSVFVVWRSRVLLHEHPKLGLWLPPGGHVERNELPDDAAVREVLEESGVRVTLVHEPAIVAPGPRQLARPRGVQLEAIGANHEHIDLIYFATPEGGDAYGGKLGGELGLFAWYTAEEAASLDLSPEIRAWVALAFEELALKPGSQRPAL